MSIDLSSEEIESFIVKDRDIEETVKIYGQWAENYEKNCFNGYYNGPWVFVKIFLESNIPKNSRILDLAAGTGKVGQLLKQNGYENIDALDGSSGMLEVAKKKNCYKNFIESFVDVNIVLPIEDKTYDVVLIIGAIGPGHIKFESLNQVIRVVKPGGLIFFTIDEPNRQDSWYSEKDFDILESFTQKGLWKSIEGYPKVAENVVRGENGVIYAMKVL